MFKGYVANGIIYVPGNIHTFEQIQSAKMCIQTQFEMPVDLLMA
jgi:hypothetical protein